MEDESTVLNDNSVINNYEEELSEFLQLVKEGEETACADEENIASSSKSTLKRKRKPELDIPFTTWTDIFLRILYPISRCMSKGLAVGLVKQLGYTPNAILNHGAKMLFFSDTAWDSFLKHLHLIECYLAKNMFGKKTSTRLLDSDIEIDILKNRGELQVRFRDLTKHDDKIQLTKEEFYVMSCATSPTTRYMKQLVFSSSVVKDYLIDAMEQYPDAQLLYSPIDTSIFNRIPYEVGMWRYLKEYEENKTKKVAKEEIPKNDETENIVSETV